MILNNSGEKREQFAIIQIGDIESSNLYIEKTKKELNENNIEVHHYWFAADIDETSFMTEIELLLPHYQVISIILPLPIEVDLNKLFIYDIDYLKVFEQEIIIYKRRLKDAK